MSNSRSRVVAFFSHHGSLGQSAILFSVAQKMAKWQRKLLLVDCDLESHGLQHIISDVSGRQRDEPGVPSGLYSLLSAAALGKKTNWRDYVVPLDHPQFTHRVDLLTAGRLSPEMLMLARDTHTEAAQVESIDGLAAYIEALRWDWRAEYDMVLINCRTSLEHVPSPWMLRLTDAMIALLPADSSRLDSVVASINRALDSFHPQSVHRQVTVVPVTVVNTARSTGTIDKAWTPRLVSAFQSYFEPWAAGVPATILAEKLVVRLQPGLGKSGSTRTVLPECESLARLIAHHFDWTRMDRYPAQWLPEELSSEQKQAALIDDACSLVHEAEAAAHSGRKVDTVSLLGMAIANWRKCDTALLTAESHRVNRAKALLLQQAKSVTGQGPSDPADNADRGSRIFKVALAAALSNLSMLLAQLQDQQAAIDALRDCIALRRELAMASRLEFEPELARSLHNLAKRLAEMGDKQTALESAAEAVAIRRRLASTDPAMHASALARSLSNLSVRFAESGASQKALIAMRESIRILRRLTRIGHPCAETDLARTLGNLARILVRNGDQRNGATTMWESVRVWMRVHRAHPEHAPDLAEALHSFALILASAGQGLMAVTAAERSVRIMRRLAQRDPRRFEPNLARSLNTLSNRLAAEGFGRRALKAIQEAVEIRTRLAARDPHKHEAELAQSLNNLSNRIAATGNWLKALDTIDMAVDIRSRLLEQRKPHDARDLAVSLYNRSLRLVEADESGLAMSNVKSTLQNIHRLLVEAKPREDVTTQ